MIPSQQAPDGPGGRGGPSDEELRRRVPRSTGGREVRIGLFVLLGLAAVLLLLFLLTDPATFRGRYMVVTEMEDAGGIRRGDPVQMRGVNIGRIHGFDLTQEGVAITLELEGEWRIPDDSRARLGTAGILEGRVVDIIPGESETYYEANDRIPGTATEGLFDVADELGGRARGVMSQVERLLDQPTVDAVHRSTRELEELVTMLSRTAREQRQELASLAESLNRSARGLEQAAEGGEDVARAAARADSTLVQLQRTSETLDDAALSLSTVLARLERGEGTLGLLATDDALYRNLEAASASVDRLAEDIRENPGRYIRFRLF